jgi:hypothetical protein
MSQDDPETSDNYFLTHEKQWNFRNPDDKTIAYIEHVDLGQLDDEQTIAEDGGHVLAGDFDPYMFDA